MNITTLGIGLAKNFFGNLIRRRPKNTRKESPKRID